MSRVKAYLSFHVLRIVFSIDITGRRFILQCERRVAHLRGQPVLQVQQTCLTYVLDLGACLTDDGGLEPHAGARIPAKHGEGTGASAA